MKSKVIGFRTERDCSAPHGEQIVHLAVLECGHVQRVGHGHVPQQLDCLECAAAVAPAKKRCENWAPATFSGHWREWHRGHGCELDPSAPASQEQP